MNEIKKLETLLIDKIAAGEVVDRPASVLKELLENSIDANSTEIKIIIKKGGHELIQVIDNGHGISKESLRLAFTRHATSKITNLNDLENITSLGFRGEALPSIASVSRCSLKSSCKNNDGNEIKIEGGEVVSLEPISCSDGSNLKINHLFYNTPARRKFLKKPETEQAKINKITRIYMLSNPDIAFHVISNDKTIYNNQSETLINRIKSIYGSNYKNNLIEVKHEKNPYKLSGFIGNLSLLKKRRDNQYLFLNGRYIQDRLLNSAVFAAYQSIIKRGEYPFFVLNINMPVNLFDINVHPAKMEVRFHNEWHVYHALKTSVSIALKEIIDVIPKFHNNPYDQPTQPIELNELPFANQDNHISQSHDIPPHRINNNAINDIAHNNFNDLINEFPNTTNLESTVDHVWQIHNKYLITEIKSGLIIIDQHVAHERILFEEAKLAIENKGLASQSLLFPQTIKLQPEEYETLTNISHYLEKIGFKFREFGENTIIIEGIPSNLKWGNESNIIKEIIDQYISLKITDNSFIENIAAIYACKSAIKAGEPLKPIERRSLIDGLFATKHPYYCPHGRPIIINLSIEDLDERFERH